MKKVLFWLYMTFGVGGILAFILTIECLNWIPFTCLALGIFSFITAAHIQPNEYIYEIHIHEEGVEEYGNV